MSDEESCMKSSDQLNLYQNFFQISQEGLFITNDHLEIIDVNIRACEVFRIHKQEFIGKHLYALLGQINEQLFLEQISQIKCEGSIKDEWVINNSLGEYLKLTFSALYSNGHYFFSIKEVFVLTKHKKNRMNSSYLNAYQQINEGIIVCHHNRTIADVNDAFLKIVEFPRKYFIKNDFCSLIHIDATKKIQENWDIAIKSGRSSGVVEFCIGKKNIIFKYHLYNNVQKQQVICLLRNITETKLNPLKSNMNNELFTCIFDEANDAIVLTDRNGMIFEVNEVACRIFELPREQLIGMNPVDFILKKNKKYRNMFETFSKKGSVREEMFFRMGNGQKKLLEFTSKKLSELNFNVTIYRNVTERYNMEIMLRKSENHFRKIFDELSVGLILWKDNKIVDINEAGLQILEYTKEKILRTTIKQIIEKVPENRHSLDKMFKKIDKARKTKAVEEIIPFVFKSGKTKYLEFTSKKNLVSGLNITAIEDVTEELEIQERLRKSDTLTVVGELAAGIAHEIRNPMTALKGFIQLLQCSVKEDFTSYFSIIMSELKRIDTIITEFLILAKPQALQYEEKNINVIVKETIDLLSAEALLYNIIFVTNLSKQGLNIFCEPNQLKQVFINIIKNAMESMNEGGTITVVTEIFDDRFIKVSITDEGIGISKERLKKLGEPFYTTKERGTGLGLMVSYKIIEEHEGIVEVESAESVGTTFTILLPRQNDLVEG
ncbi:MULTISPECIES: PAS domain S-box protein [Bacillus]|uniref:PAS domain S-box protein n=1 Tax=Bacillus TaxID=1386 RepID=UPI0002D8E2A7|nr:MULTISPECIES: PAS domain S-box protein [Bacillus]